MTFNKINRLPEFDKDLKKLAKRFRTIEEDLQILIDHGLVAFHKFNIDNGGIVGVEGLGISYPKIFKVRKFACRALKGKGANSGLRLIYAYYADKDEIELIEIYFKGDKENEDRERILKYYKK